MYRECDGLRAPFFRVKYVFFTIIIANMVVCSTDPYTVRSLSLHIYYNIYVSRWPTRRS